MRRQIFFFFYCRWSIYERCPTMTMASKGYASNMVEVSSTDATMVNASTMVEAYWIDALAIKKASHRSLSHGCGVSDKRTRHGSSTNH